MTGIEVVQLLLDRLKSLRGYAPLYVENAWEPGVDIDCPLNMVQTDEAIALAEKWLIHQPPNPSLHATTESTARELE